MTLLAIRAVFALQRPSFCDWASLGFPDTLNDKMCLGDKHVKGEKSVYGRVQAGNGKAGEAGGGQGSLGYRAKGAASMGQPGTCGVMDMRPHKPLRSESASEVGRLQRELRRVTAERDILKRKALGYFARDPQ